MIDTQMHKRIIYDEISAIKYHLPSAVGIVLGFETDEGWHAYVIHEDPPEGMYDVVTILAFDTKEELLDELDRRYGKLEEANNA